MARKQSNMMFNKRRMRDDQDSEDVLISSDDEGGENYLQDEDVYGSSAIRPR